MNLSGVFQYGNKNTSSNGSQAVHQSNAVTSAGNRHTQPLRSLAPGQTIHGEVLSKNGSEVQIRLDRDVVINARLEKNMDISPGQSMTFEVKNNTGTQIALRPLYENLAQDPNVLRALEAARLPSTEALMRMVSSMMEQGMSIDKNSVLNMSRLILANPNAAPETVVTLKNLQFPVTQENISQFESYSNYTHQLITGAKDILSGLSETFQSMISSGQEGEAVKLYTQVLQLFTGEFSTVGTGETGNSASGFLFTDLAEDFPEQGKASVLPETPENGEQLKSRENVSIKAQALSAETKALMEMTDQTGDKTVLDGISPDRDQADAGQMPDAMGKNSLQGDSVVSLLGREGADNLIRLLQGAGFPEEILSRINNQDISTAQLLKEISRMLASDGKETDTAGLKDLFGSREYGKLLDNEILRQWLLKPQDVSKKGNVEEFYSRLREQTNRLTEALGQIAKDTPLAKTLTSVQNNIEFMNQMNQLYQYVQLPLKMSGGETHGDLYVYTNKKSASKTDGSVSALLHLDMEHLGVVDVYVTMKENRVGTRFYLENERIIDFIGAHISLLDGHLTERGYSLKAEMLLKEELEPSGRTDNVIETLMGGENKDRLLSHYAFDVRA